METFEKGKAELISGIEKDAEKRAEEVLTEARKRAEEKLRFAKQKVKSILDEAEARAKEQAESIRTRVLGGISLEAKRRAMKLKDKALQEVIAGAREKLNGLVKKPEYRNILRDWIVEAAVGLGADKAVIHTSKAEKKLIGSKLIHAAENRVKKITGRSVSLSLSDDPPLAGQGVVLSAVDGKTAFNNQVSTRLLRKQRDIQIRVYKVLFEEDSPSANKTNKEL
jgi:vacuolar-type H+-ATPase subunit E/Vma4